MIGRRSEQGRDLPDTKAVASIIRAVANDEILPRFNALAAHELGEKEGGEIVTAADVESERRLEELLTDLVPGSVAVGEEGYAADNSVIDRLAGAAPVWILDPLDGTRNFAEGKERFCVIVAYCVGGVTQAGWIFDPIGDDMMYAAKGRGVRDAKGVLMLGTPPPTTTVMRGSVGKNRREHLAERGDESMPRVMVRYRCVGMEYMDMARGRLDFAEYGNLKPWDHAAGLLFHKEAGGFAAFTDGAEPYVPGPISQGRFLAASDRKSWDSLKVVMSI
ncbi:MAG: inositol monophosphatase [Rhodospirillales bacterium]|nr:inositol monophosphatase [Rhodospirillales bacterium]